jgi:thymidylate synthase
MMHDEEQYLALIRTIFFRGSMEEGRNGNVKSIFGNMLRFSLKDGVWPLLTTKKVAWKACFHELMWFLGGKTDNRLLQSKGVHIWDANGSREFLDSRGLNKNREGDLGPVYGMQWRHWNTPYDDCETNYTDEGIDQIQYVIDQLKNPETRSNRRLIVTAWNPEQIDEMALPPCHVLMQFHVRENTYLSCALYQRSGDVGLGVPFNIASYCMLTHLMAHHCGLVAEDFVYFLGNSHIYENHMEVLKEQSDRVPLDPPRIRIREVREKIEDYVLEDIEWLQPYESHGSLKMDMVA